MKHMTKGCGAPWNRWRKDIKERTRKEYKEYYDNELLTDLVKTYDPIKAMKNEPKRKKEKITGM